MKVIILCGGNGTRMNDYSFPKPLNMIHGKPSISYCLQYLPDFIDELHFIIAPHLYDYHIEEILTNQFKMKKCNFHRLPYFTRGPIESAWIGIKGLDWKDEPIVFLDNDVLYHFPDDVFTHHDSAFLGYSTDMTGSSAYSFISINNDSVIEIKEKKRISDYFCCGVYGFASLEQFKLYAEPFIHHYEKELYLSLLFDKMIQDKVKVKGIHFSSEIIHIGSLSELDSSWDKISKPSMRICFDLDNTLVTYPIIPGDYRTVRPITNMIELLRKMKEEGHTIIIHTARRMVTHRHNVGAVIRDIGRITMDTLDEFNIPYDELLFGKPIADMYIDDRAVNPYRNDIQCMGYLHHLIEQPANALPTNRYNQIRIKDGIIIKAGPIHIIEGELYYYTRLPPTLISYFPRLINNNRDKIKIELHLEYIKNIPFSTLYQSELLTEHHLDMVFEFMNILHHTPSKEPMPTPKHIFSNYINKLKDRFNSNDYPFTNAEFYQKECLCRLTEYLSKPVQIVPYIHGDMWFSNMLLTYQQELKLVDMKGRVDTLYTTGGDKLYDYGKLYQSLLGYDCALYGTSVSSNYAERLRHYAEAYFYKQGVSLDDIRTVSLSLMMGTFHAISSFDTKHRVWKWVTTLF
jgi:hypothetical protein